jgi:chromosomal replication initiation ATPase DnaA
MRSPEQQFKALTPEQEKQAKATKTLEVSVEGAPIAETETSVSYLGVTLEKAKNPEGQFVPRREQYENFINDKDIALPLQRDIAVAFLNGEPLLVDGGTSLGKTTTVRKMASELGW